MEEGTTGGKLSRERSQKRHYMIKNRGEKRNLQIWGGSHLRFWEGRAAKSQ